ncbi:sugar phosphate isomerase/epimerase family protein [Microbacterium gorillae]|uniref:sugar phosphate isomerase/epimerase family protein n=1 Tax=Microbacterium gorillae TaxID=1231063 RepID=UPI000A452956|nr:sugar phosphate isomerase/epimerase [Microbacterium gorillae]
MVRIGVQAMMLVPEIARDGAYETLRRVADLGYRVLELSQVPMTAETVDQIVRAQADFGLQVCATSAALDATTANDSLADTAKIVADAQRLGATMVRIGMLPPAMLRSPESIADFCAAADAAAVRLAEHGLRLSYHNHHLEFAKVGGRTLLEVIAERAPHLGLELDVHWIARGGRDPVRVIDQYAGRVRMVHLKDYRIALPDDAAHAARESGDGDAWRAAWNGAVQFAEVGEGNLDWPAIIEHSIAAGAEFLLVEQDELYGRTVWEALETSRRNLHAMGYGDLF